MVDDLDEDVRDIPVDTAVLLTLANGYLDAFTYVGHGHVFANAQSGNVILLGVELAQPDIGVALDHLWPVLAFVAGIAAAQVVSRRATGLRWRDPRPLVLGLQVLILLVVALLPTSAPNWTVTTSVGFASALQMASFRTVRSSTFVPIAMTGNLMRTTEAITDLAHGEGERRLVALYVGLIATFFVGALLGAIATDHLVRASSLVPALLLLVAGLLLFRRVAHDPVAG
ncbi:MAG: YoaK family protein [Nocardioides sp.]